MEKVGELAAEARWQAAQLRRRLPEGTMEVGVGLALGLAAGVLLGGKRALVSQRAQVSKAQQSAATAVRRAESDLETARRIAARDVDDAKKFGSVKFAKSMLTVADSLRHARTSAEANGASGPLVDGYGLVESQLEKALSSQDVVGFGEVGETFDPSKHEAVSLRAGSGDSAHLELGEVVQRGYVMRGRVIRAAMVVTQHVPTAAGGHSVEVKNVPTGATEEALLRALTARGIRPRELRLATTTTMTLPAAGDEAAPRASPQTTATATAIFDKNNDAVAAVATLQGAEMEGRLLVVAMNKDHVGQTDNTTGNTSDSQQEEEEEEEEPETPASSPDKKAKPLSKRAAARAKTLKSSAP